MNRIKIVGIYVVMLCLLAPEASIAGWQLYYTGKAQSMFGSQGRGNFATRVQCEAYRSSSAAFERNNSYCSGFDSVSNKPATPGSPNDVGNDTAREEEIQKQLQLQRKQAQKEREQKKFEEDKKQLLGTLRGGQKDGALNLKTGSQSGLALKGSNPKLSVTRESWTPEQCKIAHIRVVAYRDALKQTLQVAERFNRMIAADQTLRAEWEKTMTDASERAMNRGQFLWLALPLGKLERINSVAAEGIEKNGADLADLLADTTDPAKREQIRIARQFVSREKEVVGKLGRSYENINSALTMGGNAPLMLEDPDESPTSPFQGDGMKLREAGDMLFGLIVERDKWKKLAANSKLAKYLEVGLAPAFRAEEAARAMFDSWYDAFDAGLAWEQLFNMNLNSTRYLEAVKKLGMEVRKRTERLKNAEKEFATECPGQQMYESASHRR